MGFQSLNISTATMTLVQITNGSVSLPLWTVNSDSSGVVRYSGNDTLDNIQIPICNLSTQDENSTGMPIGGLIYVNPIAFSNGNATGPWSSGVWMPYY